MLYELNSNYSTYQEVDDHAQQELENKLDKTETMITGELFSQESKDKVH